MLKFVLTTMYARYVRRMKILIHQVLHVSQDTLWSDTHLDYTVSNNSYWSLAKFLAAHYLMQLI